MSGGSTSGIRAAAEAGTPPLTLDPDAPHALYHQIVVALRFRIATGNIERGERLPPLRQAAETWGVSYHTVRRAYQELEEMGLVERKRGSGTTVISSLRADPANRTEVSEFLERVATEGRFEFGLSGVEVARLLEERSRRPEPGQDAVLCTVVECNEHQCADLAGQVRERFAGPVHEHVLDDPGGLAAGPIIGTYFHLEEMLDRWPERRSDMYFPALRLDRALRGRILELTRTREITSIPLCEREKTLAEAMAEDIENLVDGLEVVPTVCADEAELRGLGREGPALVAPRLWNDLPGQVRSRPNLLEVRYVFRDYDMNALGSAVGWERTERSRA